MAMGLQGKQNIGQDYTEVVMHVVMDSLKLGEIKGCDRSKGVTKKANGIFFFFFLKGFEVSLWGVKWTETA